MPWRVGVKRRACGEEEHAAFKPHCTALAHPSIVSIGSLPRQGSRRVVKQTDYVIHRLGECRSWISERFVDVHRMVDQRNASNISEKFRICDCDYHLGFRRPLALHSVRHVRDAADILNECPCVADCVVFVFLPESVGFSPGVER